MTSSPHDRIKLQDKRGVEVEVGDIVRGRGTFADYPIVGPVIEAFPEKTFHNLKVAYAAVVNGILGVHYEFGKASRFRVLVKANGTRVIATRPGRKKGEQHEKVTCNSSHSIGDHDGDPLFASSGDSGPQPQVRSGSESDGCDRSGPELREHGDES